MKKMANQKLNFLILGLLCCVQSSDAMYGNPKHIAAVWLTTLLASTYGMNAPASSGYAFSSISNYNSTPNAFNQSGLMEGPYKDFYRYDFSPNLSILPENTETNSSAANDPINTSFPAFNQFDLMNGFGYKQVVFSEPNPNRFKSQINTGVVDRIIDDSFERYIHALMKAVENGSSNQKNSSRNSTSGKSRVLGLLEKTLPAGIIGASLLAACPYLNESDDTDMPPSLFSEENKKNQGITLFIDKVIGALYDRINNDAHRKEPTSMTKDHFLEFFQTLDSVINPRLETICWEPFYKKHGGKIYRVSDNMGGTYPLIEPEFQEHAQVLMADAKRVLDAVKIYQDRFDMVRVTHMKVDTAGISKEDELILGQYNQFINQSNLFCATDKLMLKKIAALTIQDFSNYSGQAKLLELKGLGIKALNASSSQARSLGVYRAVTLD